MKATQESKLPFEQALAELEELVARIETGDIPLSDLVDRFERGTKLLNVCTKRLADAELKIQLLQKDRRTIAFEALAPDTD
ncbi:hypothetical protein ASA1KI_25630 [Opitutales bacterium ASA1]|uniref:exodeoxyribonuclease VII small subunit n=1 Tax=Congregicoccus parvus TaxID=3081749 RepID=UPI002B2BA287|nr:hypothetical protein ASA1KI_25630 [Opitutales bacterium ASA1]